MCWSVCLFITTLFASIELNKQSIFISLDISAVIIHLFLVAGLVLLISYFNDLYSCVILLIYQIGLVINHSGFKDKFDHTFGLCMLVFNIICFIWILVKFVRSDKNELEEENKKILYNYNKGNESGVA